MLKIIEVMCIISKMNLIWHQSGIRAPLIHNEKAATHLSHTFWDDDMNAGHKRHGLQSCVSLNWVSVVDVSHQHDCVLSKRYARWLRLRNVCRASPGAYSSFLPACRASSVEVEELWAEIPPHHLSLHQCSTRRQMSARQPYSQFRGEASRAKRCRDPGGPNMTAPDASSPLPDRLAFREASTQQMEQRKGSVQHGSKNKTLKCFTFWAPYVQKRSLFFHRHSYWVWTLLPGRGRGGNSDERGS